jgi:serine O-acetyltransferase
VRTSLTSDELKAYLGRQLDHFFPDGRVSPLDGVVDLALERLESCFAPVRLRMYRSGSETLFNHLHSDHYATFVFLASNVAFHEGEIELASKLYCLNKSLNGLMCMYDNDLPEHFLLIHTAGMLLGKAEYGDYFVAIHNAGVGTDRGRQPSIGPGVVIYGGAKVIGSCDIGRNVTVAANALVRNEVVQPGHVVAGSSPSLIIKPAKRSLAREFYDCPDVG